MKDQIKQIGSIIDDAKNILVIQADNPDADSLASSLALEQILSEYGKKVSLHGAVDMPGYLKYLKGWDRVSQELPKDFDATIIVDTSSKTLLQKLEESGQKGWVAAKPVIVLDHHTQSENKIDYAKIVINDTDSSSTGELIYKIARTLSWPVDKVSGQFILAAILGDTQGLTNDLTTSGTYRVIAQLVDLGVNRPVLEESRRAFSKMTPDIFIYKGKLIERSELLDKGRIAYLDIPYQEIVTYSPQYNPAPLIQPDLLQIEGVAITIVLKVYGDGRITGAIRSNQGFPIAAKLAEKFGGGGHPYASGFKLLDNQPLDKVKNRVIEETRILLDNTKGSTP